MTTPDVFPLTYVTVQFPHGGRHYTYHYEGEPLSKGDTVKVPCRNPDDGWTRAVVQAVDVKKPKFMTKALLGRVKDGE